MDWVRYRALCDRGDVQSRWLLERTAELLEASGAAEDGARLRAELDRPPLPRPADHRGGAASEFRELGLDAATARRVADRVAALAGRPGVRLADGRGLGGLPEAWDECASWLEGTHPRSPHRAGRDHGEGED